MGTVSPAVARRVWGRTCHTVGGPKVWRKSYGGAPSRTGSAVGAEGGRDGRAASVGMKAPQEVCAVTRRRRRRCRDRAEVDNPARPDRWEQHRLGVLRCSSCSTFPRVLVWVSTPVLRSFPGGLGQQG